MNLRFFFEILEKLQYILQSFEEDMSDSTTILKCISFTKYLLLTTMA